MKQRSREINVFSVSALDLFASALGAFILMSLVFMVFFSMASRDAGDADALQVSLQQCETQLSGSVDGADLALCEAQLSQSASASDLAMCEAQLVGAVDASELAQCEATGAALAEQLRQVRIPHLDVVICLDVTLSMSAQIAGLKLEISDLARVLNGLAPSAGVGVVAFGDALYDEPIHQHPIVETASMGSLTRFVDLLEPGLGEGSGENYDVPEALYAALQAAIAMNWRAQSERRYIIVITDAPAYPYEVASALDRARDFAQSGNQHVSTVMVGRYDAQGFLRELARSGQGQFVNGVGGQSMIAAILLAILD